MQLSVHLISEKTISRFSRIEVWDLTIFPNYTFAFERVFRNVVRTHNLHGLLLFGQFLLTYTCRKGFPVDHGPATALTEFFDLHDVGLAVGGS